MYDNTECTVMVRGRLTEWFEVEEGVRQGLSPTVFNIFLDFVMRDFYSEKVRAIHIAVVQVNMLF